MKKLLKERRGAGPKAKLGVSGGFGAEIREAGPRSFLSISDSVASPSYYCKYHVKQGMSI